MPDEKKNNEKKNDEKKDENKYANIAVEVERQGTKIILPGEPHPGMTLAEARQVIERLEKDENEEFSVVETIAGYHYLDGAVAFWKAIRRKYGFASPVPTPGFFGPQPPRMLTVETGPNNGDSVQVPWGKMIIPIPGDKGADGKWNTATGIAVETGAHEDDHGAYVFHVSGKLKRKNTHIVKELVELARDIIASESIFRGKAVTIHDNETAPKFINVMRQAAEELILNREIAALVEVNLMTPIRQTALCQKHGIPIKRGVLLEGHYGTGKSLTGAAVARTCAENGWTYFLLDDVRFLEGALRLAKNYAPAVVFAEDIDRVLAERDDDGNNLINTIDGVVAKDMQIMVVLTTNFADKLDRSMLRPGRLDAVIHYSPPDADSVMKLIELYSRGLIRQGESLTRIGKKLAGQIPATIREVVERSKLAMISRVDTFITEDDLLTAALGMEQHLALLHSDKKSEAGTPIAKLGEAIIALVTEGITRSEEVEALDHNVDKTRANLDYRISRTGQDREEADKKRHLEVGQKLDGIEGVVKKIAHAAGVKG